MTTKKIESTKKPQNNQELSNNDKDDQKILQKLEATIENGLGTFFAVGNCLLQIRESELYRFQYSSFEEYCLERWGFKRAHAYRLCKSSKALSDMKEQLNGIATLPKTEGQIRPLLSLKVEDRPKAWSEILAGTKGKKITSSVVSEYAAKYIGDKTKKRRDPEESKRVNLMKKVKKCIVLAEDICELSDGDAAEIEDIITELKENLAGMLKKLEI